MTTLGPVTIDELLERSLHHWSRLPRVAAEIDMWDELEQIDFLMEWPLQEDDLEELAELLASDTPTPDQRRRYADLLQLVDTNRPIVNALWQGGRVPETAGQPRSGIGD